MKSSMFSTDCQGVLTGTFQSKPQKEQSWDLGQLRLIWVWTWMSHTKGTYGLVMQGSASRWRWHFWGQRANDGLASETPWQEHRFCSKASLQSNGTTFGYFIPDHFGSQSSVGFQKMPLWQELESMSHQRHVTAWEDHCSDFFIVIPMPFSKYLAISKLMQIANGCYHQRPNLETQLCVTGVRCHTLGVWYWSQLMWPLSHWAVFPAVLRIGNTAASPALEHLYTARAEFQCCPPSSQDWCAEVLSLSQWVASLGHSKAQLPELVVVSETASFFHTFSGEIILIRFEFWPLILTLFSPAWTWLEIFHYKTPYSLATLYEGKWLIIFFFHCFYRLYCSSSSKRFTNCEIDFIYLEPQLLCRPVIYSQVSIQSTFKENEHFPAKTKLFFFVLSKQ